MAKQYWLMKSEPDAYAWEQLVHDGIGMWDGVRNHTAKLNLMAMKVGDEALFYHSNIGVEAVGIMTVVQEAAPDSTDSSGKWIAVHVAPVERLQKPVTLKAMKADSALANMAMLRQSRLSVSPLTDGEFKHILAMSKA